MPDNETVEAFISELSEKILRPEIFTEIMEYWPNLYYNTSDEEWPVIYGDICKNLVWVMFTSDRNRADFLSFFVESLNRPDGDSHDAWLSSEDIESNEVLHFIVTMTSPNFYAQNPGYHFTVAYFVYRFIKEREWIEWAANVEKEFGLTWQDFAEYWGYEEEEDKSWIWWIVGVGIFSLLCIALIVLYAAGK